ncbi:hotdog domain-containing protein, partial [Campylobacter coli]|uniref:hotdog domain-containing protein n=1 Tax=Campylobacter coli TaxID=195 RepID=UPI0039A49CAE
ANCFFIKSAKLGDIIEVKTKLLKIKNASVDIAQEIYRDEILLFSQIIFIFFKYRKAFF